MLYVSGFLQGLALFVPIVFLAPMAQHYGMSAARAAALVGAIGIASTGARVVFGLIADRIGVLFAYKAATSTMWLGFLVWLPSRSFGGLLAMAVVFGAGYGGIIALMPALLGTYFGVENLGSASGTMQTSASVGSLLGPPLAGLLIGSTDRYGLALVVAFVVCSLGTLASSRCASARPCRGRPERAQVTATTAPNRSRPPNRSLMTPLPARACIARRRKQPRTRR